MVGYIFGGNTGISSPEELANRRRMAQTLMRNSTERIPQNPWEGLALIANALGGNYSDYKLRQEEEKNRGAADSSFKSILARMTNNGTPISSEGPSQGARIDATKSAFLDTIAGPESGGAYDKVYGGGQFTGYADHPRQDIQITSGPNRGKTSSAAGRYQFLGSTWDEQKKKLKLPDFGPESQDAAAWDLASSTYNKATGGNLSNDLMNADEDGIKKIAKLLSGKWTSMPGGIEQTVSDQDFLTAYNRNLAKNSQVQPVSFNSSAGIGLTNDARTPTQWPGNPDQPAGDTRPVHLAQASGPGLNEMLQLYSDPWTTPEQKSILQVYIQREMDKADPRNKLEMRKLEAEVGSLENPKRPRPATPEEKSAFGVGPDVPLVIDDEGKPSILSAGGVNINMPDQPSIGNIPPGYQAIQDPKTKAWTMGPIPGSPAAAEVDATKAADENRRQGETQRSDLITQEIDRTLGVMDGGILPDTGWGALLAGVPGTDAKAVSSLLDTIKANIGFGELNKMRQQSPTGGALGNITEKELAYLQSVAGSLDQAQSAGQLKDNLNRLWNAYQDVVHGQGNGPERRKLSFDKQSSQPNQRIRVDGQGRIVQ